MRLGPPLGLEDLDEKIEALKKKEQEYIEEGEARLKQEKTDREQRIEQEVDEELERERKAAQEYGDEGYYDEEDGYDEGKDGASKGPARGGAGANRSTAMTSERDRKRGNDPRKRRGKGDFQGSDEDEEEEKEKPAFRDPYAKPSRGGGQQVNQSKRGGKQGGRKEMDLDDEEDFPAL